MTDDHSVETRVTALEARVHALESQAQSTTIPHATPIPAPAPITPMVAAASPSTGTSCLGLVIAFIVGPIVGLIVSFSLAFGEFEAISSLVGFLSAIFVGSLLYKAIAKPNISVAAPILSQTVTHTDTQQQTGEGWEAWIGRQGLGLAGITLLVLGVGFFLVLILLQLGPLQKDLLGLLVGGMLVWLSIVVERKSIQFGQILIGGASAIIYFTVYAMHFFPAARVIQSQAVDLALLALTAAAVGAYTLQRYQTEQAANLAMVLLYLTVNLGDYTTFTFPALSLITLAVLAVAWRKGWSLSFFLGAFLTYLTYLGWGMGLHSANGQPLLPAVQFTSDIVYLNAYYLIFMAAVFLAKFADSKLRAALLGLNSMFYVVLFGTSLASQGFVGDHGWSIFLLFVAVANGLWALIGQELRQSEVRETAVTISIVALFTSIALYFTGPVITWAWLGTSVALMVVGLASRWKTVVTLGLVGFVLTAIRLTGLEFWNDATITGTVLHVRLVLAGAIVASALVFRLLHARIAAVDAELGQFAIHEFAIICFGGAVLLLGIELPATFIAMSWGLVGAGGLMLGIATHDKLFRGYAMAVLALMLGHIALIDITGLEALYRVIAFVGLGILLLGASWIYNRYLANIDDAPPTPPQAP